MSFLIRFCGAVAALGFSLSAAAQSGGTQVYRWVDKNGAVHYSDHPDSPNAKPVDLPQLQTFDSGAVTKGQPVANEDAVAASATSSKPALTSPTPGQTIRDPQGNVTLSASAAVADGGGLLFYLDGATLNATPTVSTQYALSGVARGEHRAAVATADAQGNVLARSDAIVFYMLQPSTLDRPSGVSGSGLGPDQKTGLPPDKTSGLPPDKVTTPANGSKKPQR